MAHEQQFSSTPDERWLPIPGFEGYYEVSDQGRVRSVERIVPRGTRPMRLRPKQLTLQYRPDTGYYVVKLSKDGQKRNWYVHRLVLMAFIGLPEQGQEACHGNDIRTDNRLSNLRWDSHLENVRDAVKRGRMRIPNPGQTHCKRGHELTFNDKQQRRICHPCRRFTERRRYHERKAS